MSAFKKEMASSVVLAVILALAFGWVATSYFPSQVITTQTSPQTTVTSIGMTSTKISVTTSEKSVFSSTAPCGSSGAFCGGASIKSANLTVNGNTSTLEITLAEVGNDYIGSATVYVNGTVIGTPPSSEYQPPGNIILNIQPNESTVLVLVIQSSTLQIHVGVTYPILVYTWLGMPDGQANSGLPEIVNVTAV